MCMILYIYIHYCTNCGTIKKSEILLLSREAICKKPDIFLGALNDEKKKKIQNYPLNVDHLDKYIYYLGLWKSVLPG